MYLREYDDLLPPIEFYSLLALVSCACRAFNSCSKVHSTCRHNMSCVHSQQSVATCRVCSLSQHSLSPQHVVCVHSQSVTTCRVFTLTICRHMSCVFTLSLSPHVVCSPSQSVATCRVFTLTICRHMSCVFTLSLSPQHVMCVVCRHLLNWNL